MSISFNVARAVQIKNPKKLRYHHLFRTDKYTHYEAKPIARALAEKFPMPEYKVEVCSYSDGYSSISLDRFLE